MILTDEIITAYIKGYYKDMGRSPATIKTMTGHLKAVADYFDGGEITQEGLAEYANHLETNNAVTIKTRTAKERKTIERPLSVKTRAERLKAINKLLERHGENISIKPPEIQIDLDQDENAIPPDQFIRLCKTAGKMGEYRVAAIMLTFAGAGLRYSELKFVTPDSIKDGRIDILKGKGNKARRVPVSKYLKAVLKWYQDKAGIAAGELFQGRTGKTIDLARLSKKLHAIAGAARGGIKQAHIHPHAFRHLFATEFTRYCGNEIVLSKLMGHTKGSSGVTARYVNFSEKEKREMIEQSDLIKRAFKALQEGATENDKEN